jgi:hypothetical protein
MTIANNPIVNAGLLYVNELRLTYATNTSIGVSSGAARNSTNVADIILKTDVVVDAQNIGVNGIDTGSLVANSYYAVYIIGDSTDNHLAGIVLSLSSTNPYLPMGYDMYRRIGWVKTDSLAHIAPFEQMGVDQTRKYYYAVPINILTNGSATSFSLVGIGSSVPLPNTIREILVSLTYTPSSAANSAQFQISNTLFGPAPMIQFGCGVAATQFGTLTLPTLFSFIIYKVSAGDTLTLNLSGYTDYL